MHPVRREKERRLRFNTTVPPINSAYRLAYLQVASSSSSSLATVLHSVAQSILVGPGHLHGEQGAVSSVPGNMRLDRHG